MIRGTLLLPLDGCAIRITGGPLNDHAIRSPGGPLNRRTIRITGGPFDALPEGAQGLCLEAASARIAEARWRFDIADFGVPSPAALRPLLAEILTAMRAAPDAAYHIGCRAGLGRTGLVMGCLARMVGVAGDPVAWVRAQYDPHAIETPAQEEFTRAF